MTKQTNHKLPIWLADRLKAESERSGVPQSEIVRRAIRRYLDEVELAQGHPPETATSER